MVESVDAMAIFKSIVAIDDGITIKISLKTETYPFSVISRRRVNTYGTFLQLLLTLLQFDGFGFYYPMP